MDNQFTVQCKVHFQNYPSKKVKVYRCAINLIEACHSLLSFKVHILKEINLSMSSAKQCLLQVGDQAILSQQELQTHLQAFIKRQQLIELMLTKFTQAKPGLQFDAEGQVKQDNFLYYERPNYAIYPSEAEEKTCVFCKESSANEYLREQVGPVFKVKAKKTVYFLHELCAIWTPEVYLSDTNKFVNLAEASLRCQHLECSFCEEVGAGLGCFEATCKQSFHYLCAKMAGCVLVKSKFKCYCPAHQTLLHESELEEEDSLKQYLCQVCKSGRDEDQTVICDKCDQAWHIDCHEPQMTAVPLQGWVCGSCAI